MPNLTPEKELLILDALKAKIESVAGAENVLVENPLIDSKQDAVERLTVQNSDDQTEVKYIYISFLGFEDSETDGCDDEPVVTLTYNAHVVWGFNERRGDESFSEKDFKALVLNLRNKFLESRRELLPDCEHQPLKQQNFILLADDPLTGAYSHFIDLILKVDIF
ncbi:MAG: hypothetical protein JSS81_26780 [Acidobacteria bacterium]|nr:hypothetical protein [Acidobacteriota bacterium]